MLRKRIPKRLQAASGRRGVEVKISTGTADKTEAKRRWSGVLAQYAAMEAEWERKAGGEVTTIAPPAGRVSQQTAAALAGVWFREQVAARGCHAGARTLPP
jgi:hypothetical protein